MNAPLPSLDAPQLLLLGVVGVAAGWVNTLAGGGSLLVVPLMVFMGLPGPVANGTNRIAIIAQNLASVGTFHARGHSDFRLSGSLAAAASAGALVGAHLGVSLDGIWFNRVLSGAMIGVMVLMATGRDQVGPAAEPAHAPRNLVLGHVLMVGVGFWGGFIQVGVGFLLMPVLYRVMGLDLVRVNVHKVFVVLAFSLVAFAVFAAKVPIDWRAGAALAFGNGVGGWLGARATIAKGAPLVRRALYFALGAMIVKLLFFSR